MLFLVSWFLFVACCSRYLVVDGLCSLCVDCSLSVAVCLLLILCCLFCFVCLLVFAGCRLIFCCVLFIYVACSGDAFGVAGCRYLLFVYSVDVCSVLVVALSFADCLKVIVIGCTLCHLCCL